MSRRYPVIYEGEDGWSGWLIPEMGLYKMACCDCGLVHNLQFGVIEVGRTRKDGTFTYFDKLAKKNRVKFRAQRNKRATAACRRKKK